jgi:glycine C-acetyltransferase
MDSLRRCLEAPPAGTDRVVVAFDGVFSMRGDIAPIDRIVAVAEEYQGRFPDGVATVVDDSHGVGAYGPRGRGTADYTGCRPDVVVGTFGKAFGVNGGFVAASATVVEAVRQRADTYIYSNPLSVADCAAAAAAVGICDSPEGLRRLRHLERMAARFRGGIEGLGWESMPGPHPIVPLLVRDTATTHRLVDHLFEQGVLVVGLAFPVVPRGDETIRFQVNAAHTEADIDQVLAALSGFSR